MILRSLIFFLSCSMIAGATPWSTTSLNGGTETGSVSSVAVDSAGRIHAVYSVRRAVSDPTPIVVNQLIYQIRSNGSGGFTSTDDGIAIVDVRPSAFPPLHVSIDVTDDFTVQIAMVDTAGVVRIYEKPKFSSSSWSATVLSELASTDGKGGISLRSRGDNGSRSSALTFTKNQSGASGGVQFSEQESDGSWRAPIDIFTGLGTGRSPVLVNTGFTFGPRMIVSYNSTANRIQAAAYAARAPDFTISWRAPVEVAPAFTATRLDAEARGGLIGVAFVSSAASGAESEVSVRYASDRLDALGSWVVSSVASSSDLGSSAGVGFGPNVALAFDAERNPWVCYTHDIEVGLTQHTTEIHARRSLPGIGWEDSLVDSIPQIGTTLGLTNSLSLASGDNGDPALLYERETTNGYSNCTFARPVAAPWQLKATPNPGVQRSKAAFAAGADGSLHLATITNGGMFGFRVTTFSSNGSETVEPMESPGFHPFIAMTSTPDGTLHLVAVRTVTLAETSGQLLYSHRPPGGTFSYPSTLETGPISLGGATPLPIVLRSDQAGALYLLYDSVATGPSLLKRSAPETLWIDQFPPGLISSTGSSDLAVRGDGGYAIAVRTIDGGTQAFTLWSNIDPLTGALTAELESYEWGFPETISEVTCAILPNGRPTGAWVADDIINFAYPTPDGTFLAAVLASSGTFPNAALALANIAGEVRLFVCSSASGGTLSDILMVPMHEPIFRYRAQVRTLVQHPKLAIDPVVSQPLSLAVDSSGFPALAISTGNHPVTPTDIYLARPADGLDPDGDRIPLLLEAAHCLNLSSPDPHTLLPAGQASLSSGEVLLSSLFRRPTVEGEYIYLYEASDDLKNWSEEVSIPGEITVSDLFPAPVPGHPSCWNSGVTSRYFGDSLDANQRRFTRLRVLRDR